MSEEKFTELEQEVIQAFQVFNFRPKDSDLNMTPQEFWTGAGAGLDLESLADRRKPLPADIPLNTLLKFTYALYREINWYNGKKPDMGISDDRLALMESVYPGITEWFNKQVAEAMVMGNEQG